MCFVVRNVMRRRCPNLWRFGKSYTSRNVLALGVVAAAGVDRGCGVGWRGRGVGVVLGGTVTVGVGVGVNVAVAVAVAVAVGVAVGVGVGDPCAQGKRKISIEAVGVAGA